MRRCYVKGKLEAEVKVKRLKTRGDFEPLFIELGPISSLEGSSSGRLASLIDRDASGSDFWDVGWVGSRKVFSGLGWVDPWVQTMGPNLGPPGEISHKTPLNQGKIAGNAKGRQFLLSYH